MKYLRANVRLTRSGEGVIPLRSAKYSEGFPNPMAHRLHQRLEVTLKTLLESVDLAENIIERVTGMLPVIPRKKSTEW